MPTETRKLFSDWEDDYAAFVRDWSRYDAPPPTGIATEGELLLATYTYEDYSGDAFVLFQRDGKLYEVHGSHCSCNGLEDQWEPEQTTWEALALRPREGDWPFLREHRAEARETFWRLVDAARALAAGAGRGEVG